MLEVHFGAFFDPCVAYGVPSRCSVFAAPAARFAGDEDRCGVAISRMAQIVFTAVARLVDEKNPVRRFLDKKECAAAFAEAAKLRPHLQARCLLCCVCCCQMLIASLEQRRNAKRRKEGSQLEMMSQRVVGKDRTKVAESARAVYQWLMQKDSPLRDLLAALSDGGAYFTSSTHVKVSCGAVRFRKIESESAVGISEDQFSRMICARLC